MMRMIRTVTKATALVALACAALFLFTEEAAAQTRAALVKNVDEPGRQPYQSMVEFNTSIPDCPINSFCIVGFPVVPAGKRLIVQHVTVLIAVASGGQPNYLAFGDSFSTNTGNVAIVQPNFTQGSSVLGSFFWFLDRDVHVYYEAGGTPKLKVGASANFAFVGNASLHGYLIDAN